MSYVQIPNELFKANLTSLQFRFLANFIRISGLNNGHSFFGYPNLANINQCGKVAAIKTVQELEKLGFIQVVERGNRSRSNDILLTLDKGLSRLNSGENDEIEGYLKDTPNTEEGYLKDTPGYLKDTPGYLKDTPHKDLKDLNKLNLNNIHDEGYLKDTPKTEEGAEKNIAPDDVASGRSMPDGEQVAESSARKDEVESAQTELEDFCIISAFFEVFPAIKPWINISKVGGYMAIQPIGSLGERYFSEIKERAAGWFALHNIKLVFVPANQKLKGQLLKGGAA